MIRHPLAAALLAMLCAAGGTAAAQTAAPAAPASAAQELTAGEVRKIDKAARTVTLKHGEIRNLDMPPMTMVFKARDVAMLAKLKVGDKVRFHAEKSKDDLLLTVLEPAR
ncbi:copper-binding protein [Ideonella sp. A 288]|uniref:copper-binding protein n=1 Tax=Ideonella sp. A 288 TaxID=1962181 RepID=UPI000B4A6ADF|nr:copper-binding protein [Ideonella sp. A 288]